MADPTPLQNLIAGYRDKYCHLVPKSHRMWDDLEESVRALMLTELNWGVLRAEPMPATLPIIQGPAPQQVHGWAQNAGLSGGAPLPAADWQTPYSNPLNSRP